MTWLLANGWGGCRSRRLGLRPPLKVAGNIAKHEQLSAYHAEKKFYVGGAVPVLLGELGAVAAELSWL